MDEFISRLAPHDVIALDTSILIYHFEAHPRYLPLTRVVLERINRGLCSAVISVLVLMELTVQPLRLEQLAVAQEYEALLANFPHLQLCDVDRAVTRRAARLRARHNVRPVDALHVAGALEQGATAFITNDLMLARVQAEIDIVTLEEFAPASV
ncbi:MAG: PIN domain-containing protein [Caldilineaceae bacterium]|nr:PIN domain-containing protein [Caldilineaceae bacterium]